MNPSPKGQCAQISRRRKLQLDIDANSAFRKQFGIQGNKAMS